MFYHQSDFIAQIAKICVCPVHTPAKGASHNQMHKLHDRSFMQSIFSLEKLFQQRYLVIYHMFKSCVSQAYIRIEHATFVETRPE